MKDRRGEGQERGRTGERKERTMKEQKDGMTRELYNWIMKGQKSWKGRRVEGQEN